MKTKLKNLTLIIGIIILLIFAIIAFIPIIIGYRYVYPPVLPEVEDVFIPERQYFTNSIVMILLNNSNPLGLITFISCLLTSGFSIYALIDKYKHKKLFLICLILILINIILIFASVICALAQNNYVMSAADMTVVPL